MAANPTIPAKTHDNFLFILGNFIFFNAWGQVIKCLGIFTTTILYVA